MAAEVPVSDVLYEAVEYLSKLGTNLRSRSENLKEKRIKKGRLRNAHAVHKAANKALLICELSKKSIDYVETCVRKVLSIVDASQANIGAKSIDTKTEESQKKFYNFEFESYKLRISKKIPIKHYMSVKVLAKDMPVSMLEKYPVYYDCKLKRQRRKAAEGEFDKNTSRKSSVSDTNLNQEESCDNQKEKVKDIASDTCETERCYKDDAVDRDKAKTNQDFQNGTPDSGVTEIDCIESDSNQITGGVPAEATEINVLNEVGIKELSSMTLEDFENKSDEGVHSFKSKLSGNSKDLKANGKHKSDKKGEAGIRKKLSRIKIIDNSSESDEESQKIKENLPFTSEENRKRLKNELSSSDEIGSKSKKIKLSEVDDNSKSIKESHDVQESNNSEIEKKELDDESKPLIRCVNISKLLKPDVLETKISKISEVDQSKSNKLSNTRSDSTKPTKNEKAGRTKDKTVIKNDDEFWAQKRREVKDFKPKQFTININRLPHISINFLLSHNLKKIIQGSKTICEVRKEKEKEIGNNIHDVKNALLNDSDSDENESIVKAKAKKVKNSLLKNLDSNTEQNSEIVENSNLEKLPDPAAVKNALLNDSGDDKNGKQTEEVETHNESDTNDKSKGNGDSEKIKSALLNDSDSDKNEEQAKDRTRSHKTDGNKKKQIEKVVSENIKNSLLNDSDSDKNGEQIEFQLLEKNKKSHNSDTNDTPNDREKGVSDEIKNALLNDSDSDKKDQAEEEKTRSHKTATNNSPKQIEKVVSESIKNALLNDSDSDKNVEQIDDEKSKSNDWSDTSDSPNVLEQVVFEKIKSALLDDSDSDKNGEQSEEKNSKSQNVAISDSAKEQEQGISEKIKNALLNDSDSNISQEKNDTCDRIPSPKDINDENDGSKIKNISEDGNVRDESTQHIVQSNTGNYTSDCSSQSSVITKKKKKIKKLKHKRKHVRNRAKKTSINYSSSSENEKSNSQDSGDSKKPRHKQGRKKSYISSSSSASEDNKKNDSGCNSNLEKNKPKTKHSDSNNTDSRNTDHVDGVDEHSDSSVSKMVRSKAKPSGSSGQNSDNQDASDKDIDGLTNLKNLNKTYRRRGTASTKKTESRESEKNSRSKPKVIIGEDLLKAESSSEVSEDDNIGEEDLPPMPGLNGDSIGHLAKDDLLGESDSSLSHKEQSEDANVVDDSEEEENVKLKRRKANAISSDSEGATSRRKPKDGDERVSDFEDTEDESSESNKRSKRKKKVSESDASAGSSNDGGKKKRRRIKQLDSDVSGSDTENEGRNKHGRKNIRKVMGKNQLEEATKKAAREEKERIARITERQKLYNNLDFDESGKPDEVVLEKVVLDFDPETKEPLIEVDRGLVKKLKPHQANGIKFMWDACFESVKRIKRDRGSGCILAHCMGLGKTLQVISLTHTLLTHGSLTGVNRVLVVCPLSTVLNWVNEFRMWLKHADSEFEVDVYELSRYKQNSERAFQLQQWLDNGGVCVLGYEMFRNLSADNNKKFKKKMLRSFQESLVDPGPDLVVCDEGHLLKNEKTSLSQSMNKVKTQRRIVLTGTPLQNNLKEYYCMVQFVKPNLLGKYNEYLNRFVNPITNGQYTDSTEHDIRVMKRRSHVLHKMLDGAVQRRDYGVLAPFLPPKHEFVLFITLTDVQVKLYEYYLEKYSRRPLPGKSSGFLFPDFQSLQRIWTHPLVLKYNSERYEIMQQKKREREEEDSEGSLVDFIDDDSTPEESSTEESSDDSSDVSDDSRKKSKKKKSAKKSKAKGGSRRGTRANPVEIEEDDHDVAEVVEVKTQEPENPTEWWIKLVEDEELEDMRNSHKLVLLFDILRQCEAIGDKLLVFSQSLYSLDLIEHFLGKVDEATQEGRIDEKLGNHVGSWSPGVDYFRLDGSTSCENRSIWCKNFNREDNPRARLFLISTRAGGLGINLVAANRVVIFDVSWNPSHDVQSIFRVYRFGQKKPCYVYRFLAMGTMEEKIYERQVTKQAISKRVIDEQQIDRHYAENDLAELYKFEARPNEPRPLPTLPKDRLFAEMLREHEAQIYKYHEHDSLLENKEEETLSEEERKAAWEDFENEKNKPPPAPFASPWPMHNGMMPGLLVQQQQQLAYAALSAMLRKDMPNINDNQIRDLMPLIYNSNPGMFGGYDYGLMQKMSEIYKYAQPGMMNPAMMNPAMNSAASGGATGAAGMGGTSGLQYEPPWQRQHQQQQQMRLQQLMQQNQQMGAKFYAGGLGSRDPVAMALQQQRAREIMMGGAARPRGRPPLAPPTSAPPASAAAAQDVVDLDSD